MKHFKAIKLESYFAVIRETRGKRGGVAISKFLIHMIHWEKAA
ncbi:MAG TPA: hypothetical protein VIF60_23925 [Burkholderiaceae bacterium]